MWLLDGTWQMHDGMGWWMLWGGAMMVLFWGVIIGGAVWLVARLGADRGGRRDESALDVARRRYASGELTREEFDQIRKDLA